MQNMYLGSKMFRRHCTGITRDTLEISEHWGNETHTGQLWEELKHKMHTVTI